MSLDRPHHSSRRIAPSSTERLSHAVRSLWPGLLVRHRVLLVLLIADIVTKIAAFRFLPDGRPLALRPGVGLYLAVNEWGVMGGVEGMTAVTANPAYTMLLAAGLFVFAYAVVRLGASALSFGRRLAWGFAVFLTVAFAAEKLAVPLAGLAVPPGVIIGTIRVAALAVSVALYVASHAPLPRAAFTLLAAGALANSASYAYPPYEVVDFLMVPLRPFAALVGPAAVSDSSSIGVINFADIYLFSVPLLLVAWAASAVVARTRRAALG